MVHPVLAYRTASGELLVTWLGRLHETPFTVERAGPPGTRVWTDGRVLALEGALLAGISSAALDAPNRGSQGTSGRPEDCAQFKVCEVQLEQEGVSVADGVAVFGPDLASVRDFEFVSAAECRARVAVLEGGLTGVVVQAL